MRLPPCGRSQPASRSRPQTLMPSAKPVVSLVRLRAGSLSGQPAALHQQDLPRLCYSSPPGALNGSRSALMRAFLEKHGCMAGDGIFLPKRWCASRSGITFFGRNNFAYAKGTGSFTALFSFAVDKELNHNASSGEPPCRRVALAASAPAPVRWGPSACIPAKASPSTHGAHKTASPIVPHPSEIAPSWRRAFTVAICARRPAPATARNCGQRSLKLPCSSLSPVISSCPRMLNMTGGFFEARVRPIMHNAEEPRYFLRNAAVALGNLRDPRHYPRSRHRAQESGRARPKLRGMGTRQDRRTERTAIS